MKVFGDERHIILYAKNWYAETDTIDDLLKIASRITGVGTEYLGIKDVYYWVSRVYFECFTYEQFQRLIQEEMFDWFNGYNSVSMEDVINSMLSELACVKVLDDNKEKIMEIGKPDGTLLSLREDDLYSVKGSVNL